MPILNIQVFSDVTLCCWARPWRGRHSFERTWNTCSATQCHITEDL